MMVYGAFIDTTLTYFLLKGLKYLFGTLSHDTQGVAKLIGSMIVVCDLPSIDILDDLTVNHSITVRRSSRSAHLFILSLLH